MRLKVLMLGATAVLTAGAMPASTLAVVPSAPPKALSANAPSTNAASANAASAKALSINAPSTNAPSTNAPSTDEVDLTPPGTGVVASTHEAANPPQDSVDDSVATRWSGDGAGAWLQLDLGAVRLVTHVKVAVYQGDQRRNLFKLQYWDESGWVTAFDGRSAGSTSALETFDVANFRTSLVRYVGYGYVLNATGATGAWNSVTEIEVWGNDPATSCGDNPADVLNLGDWKVSLPIDNPDTVGTQPLEITQPSLDSYSHAPWFSAGSGSDCDRLRFRVPVNGVTAGSSPYPRSELREMTNFGTSGTHTMTVDIAVNALPAGRPHLVVAQVHDAADDDVTMFRVEGSSIYVTNDEDNHYTLVTSDYVLGTRFRLKYVVSGGLVAVYFNGALQATITKAFTGAYFTTGAYSGANCTNSSPCDESNFGQASIYQLLTTHS